MPYLRYAFQHVLHRNLDITPYIQRVLDSSTSKSGSYTDGDDLVFERVFFAIERRHQDLPAELNDFTENLECLALFLIRRAQEKGPYRLLGRDIPPSDAWKKYESERITQVAAKNVKVMQNQNQPIVPKYSVPTDTGPPAPPAPNMARVPLLTNNCIDPRLLYAYPGHTTIVGTKRSRHLLLWNWPSYSIPNRGMKCNVQFLTLKPSHKCTSKTGYHHYDKDIEMVLRINQGRFTYRIRFPNSRIRPVTYGI
ncbi:unnamed protein product [Alternaria alternata]